MAETTSDADSTPHGFSIGAREISREEVLGRAARAATGLSGLGIGQGDAVALLLRNDIPFFEATLAARMLGAYPLPINWHFTGEEIAYILRDSGAKAIVAHADLLPALSAELRAALPVLAVPTPPEIQAAYGLAAAACRVPAGCEAWPQWADAFPPRTEEALKTGLSMFYTSGTTGKPKGVRRELMTAEQEQGVLRKYGVVFGINAAMRTVIPAPIYHSAPNAYAGMAALLGADIAMMPRFDPEGLLEIIQRRAITHVQVVPTMFVRLLKLPEQVRARYDVSSLRHVVHAAAPCPPEVKQAMIQWWGPVINEYYGGTESGAVTFCGSAESLARPGTVGRAMENCTVRILDDQDRPLPAGEIGEVYMRDRSLPDFTYHGLPAKRREIERDGLITCGDMGYLDEAGYLFLCDRKIDMVISGGVNIYPAEIEAVLIGHPQVRDCAVFGIPDEEYGESLAAAVQPTEGSALSAGELQDFLRQHLAAYKVPKRIELRGDLPREDSGKIFKRKLRDPYWENVERKI